jgi:hypothetical protein
MVIADELNKGLIQKLNLSGTDFHAQLVMIWSKEKHISEPLHAFMMMVKKMMQAGYKKA